MTDSFLPDDGEYRRPVFFPSGAGTVQSLYYNQWKADCQIPPDEIFIFFTSSPVGNGVGCAAGRSGFS